MGLATRSVVVGLFCVLGVGCGGKPASLPAAADYRLSERADLARRLLDAGDHLAAQRVFDTDLDANPRDAGLLCQYVRFLFLSRDPAYPNFIQSPLHKGGGFYWVEGVAKRAIGIAAGLDPKCKPYLVDVALGAFAERVDRAAGEGRGLIGHGRTLFNHEEGRETYYSGFALSMVEVCFTALECDPARAARWVATYDRLTQRYVQLGKPASAMMLGNLTGDLAQAGKGPEDFKRANRAFLDALAAYIPDGENDWVKDAADAYPSCFRDELLAIMDGGAIDPTFQKLERELERRGVAVPRPDRRNPANLRAPTGAAPR